MLALPAFIGLEWKRYTSGLSRWALKQDIIRPAVGAYLPEPRYILDSSTASVLSILSCCVDSTAGTPTK